jgi:hypothetical protein
MSITSVVNQIDTQTLAFAPMAMAGIIAAQQTAAAGADKKQAVMDGILAGAKVGETVANPNVAAISGMIDMFVSIFKALNVFGFKPSVPTPTPNQ